MDAVCLLSTPDAFMTTTGLHQSHKISCSAQGEIWELSWRKWRLDSLGMKLRAPGTDDPPTPSFHFLQTVIKVQEEAFMKWSTVLKTKTLKEALDL